MVRTQVPLSQIGQVLRHDAASSTARYARVDVDQLPTVAQPWPDGVQQMSALSGNVVEYLRLRRALGFKLKREGRMLPQFVSWLDASGAQTITVELAVAWARLPEGVQPIEWARRLGVVRGFARWLHTIDPATQIPPADVFRARQQRPVP